jgi:hypothetical protein
VQLAPQPADDITCTLTNTAETVGTPLANPEIAGITIGGLAITGLGVLALRRRRGLSGGVAPARRYQDVAPRVWFPADSQRRPRVVGDGQGILALQEVHS